MEVFDYDQDGSDRTGCGKYRDEQEVRERAERQGINPRTREPITIAASKSIVFKPGKALKDTL